MITNKDVRVENGNLVLNGDKYPLDGQSPEAIMQIVKDNSDTTPTENSTAPITSGGVAASLFEKSNICVDLSSATTISELVDYCRTIGSNDIGHVHFGISNYSISQLFGTSRFTFLYRFSSGNYGWILCISDNRTISGIRLLQIAEYPNVYMQSPTMTTEKIQ